MQSEFKLLESDRTIHHDLILLFNISIVITFLKIVKKGNRLHNRNKCFCIVSL